MSMCPLSQSKQHLSTLDPLKFYIMHTNFEAPISVDKDLSIMVDS